METVVKIENLVKRYKELLALDHLNLTIQKGEIFGLLGPNGSGKTTTINCLLSLLSYDKGTIEIFGQPMRPDNYDVKRQIGVVMQNVAVFDELTVRENIDCFCSLYITDAKTRKRCVDDAIAFVGLEDFTGFYPKKLSGGLLRRLNIACGIAHKPRLIILDEPTVAVDPQSRNKILEGIVELNRAGATVIYTSHYMEEVEQICTRIAIMDKGKNIALGTKEELIKLIKKVKLSRWNCLICPRKTSPTSAPCHMYIRPTIRITSLRYCVTVANIISCGCSVTYRKKTARSVMSTRSFRH